MKIENDNKTNLLDSILKSGQSKSSKESGVGVKQNTDASDRVELSSHKEEVAKIREKVKTVPEIDQAKVDRIRDAIKAETYDVNGRMVARGLLKSNLLDEVL
jgi:negative regulator of flagellin synthesis FlgM